MNIHHSEPILINRGHSRNYLSNGDGDHSPFERVRHDTISRIKSSHEPRSRTHSLSPGLASPTPPTFIPDGSHEISAIGNYYLVENVEGINSGNVFRAIDINTDEELICKVYDSKQYRQAMEGYLRIDEHPNINNILDVINSCNKAYVFFHPGVPMSPQQPEESSGSPPSFRAENLHSYVRSKKKLAEVEAALLFSQVVAAVAHCHEKNIVLHDLKLRKFIFKDEDRTNVMLECLDDVCVMDCDDDSMFDRRGCPAYASPEIVCSAASTGSSGSRNNSGQISTGYSGKASDVWSLGIMLYTMLVGRYPFLDSNPVSLFTKINRCQFSMPDFLSSEARDLIRNLLRHQPSQRLSARNILDHPWLKRKGHCWDNPKCLVSLGSGGDRRRMDRDAFQQMGRHSGGHSFPTSIFSSSFYEDQMVPDIEPSRSNPPPDLVFSFGE